jgi:hypothetical protein
VAETYRVPVAILNTTVVWSDPVASTVLAPVVAATCAGGSITTTVE